MQVEIRANNPSHDSRKRRSADLALARDGSQKNDHAQIPRGAMGWLKEILNYPTASQTPPPCLEIRWSVWVMLGPFWGPFLTHFGSFLDHFWVMLGLGGPSWGPLASFGAILGSTSDFDAIFGQIRENYYSILGPILGLF